MEQKNKDGKWAPFADLRMGLRPSKSQGEGIGAAQFLIDRGIDMTFAIIAGMGLRKKWAYHAFVAGEAPLRDKNMAGFLARAERARKAQSL